MNKSEIINKINELKTETHLGYLIREVEEYFIMKYRTYMNDKIQRVRDKCKYNPNYEFTEDDKIILDMPLSSKIFHIEVREAKDYKKGQGFTYLFERGAIINYYPFQNFETNETHLNFETHLQKHFIICHEIGHIFLHMKIDEKDGDYTWRFPAMTVQHEQEADIFAQAVLIGRSRQFGNDPNKFKDHEYLKYIVVSEDDIEKAKAFLRKDEEPNN